jgi:hypothetical protein
MTYIIKAQGFHRVSPVPNATASGKRVALPKKGKGEAPYEIYIDSDQIHSIRKYKTTFAIVNKDTKTNTVFDIELQNFYTVKLLAAEGSGGPTELYVEAKYLDQIRRQLKPTFIQIKFYNNISEHEQIDGHLTGEAMGEGKEQSILINATLLRSYATPRTAEGKALEYFTTTKWAPAVSDGELDTKHIKDTEMARLLRCLKVHRLISGEALEAAGQNAALPKGQLPPAKKSKSER